jgi:hypothetical protein
MAMRSTTGRPVMGGGSRLLGRSPGDFYAPPIIGGTASRLFSMGTARKGVPAVNDQFELFGRPRSWDVNYTHAEGFCGVRWQPTWLRADGYYGSWEPAEGEVFRIHRKGASGVDARTAVFTCGANPSAVPVGDPVVLFEVDGYDGGVTRAASYEVLPGFTLPTRQKLVCTGGAGSAPWQPEGRRIIEVQFAEDLPAFDYAVPTFNAGWYQAQKLRMRHWSFYADASTRRMRWPLPWFSDNTKDLVLPNGGYADIGGLQHRPVWRDWSLEYLDFGASMVEELNRQEQEGLAYHLGDTDTTKCMIELENEPTRSWRDDADGPGYGTLLRDVWYPIARSAWGMDRTIGVSATSFKSIDSLRDDFDFTNPTGHNTFLMAHNYDGQFHIGPGGTVAIWSNIGESDYAADIIASRIAAYGYKGGGMSEAGTNAWEWWDYEAKVAEDERGRRLGRILTSMTRKNLDTWFWGFVGDGYNCVDIYDVGGKQIEQFWPGIRPYCVRADRTTT